MRAMIPVIRMYAFRDDTLIDVLETNGATLRGIVNARDCGRDRVKHDGATRIVFIGAMCPAIDFHGWPSWESWPFPKTLP